MNQNKQTIAVLLTCFNRVETTLVCLARFFAMSVPTGYCCDVYLVDDASPDQTGKRVKESYPTVNVIAGTGNLFWSGGMRRAWETAAATKVYDFYLWLNDDTLLDSHALTVLLADYKSLPEGKKGILAASFFSDETRTQIFYGPTPDDLKRRPIPSGVPVQYKGVMSGNCVLIPQFVYHQLGPISDEFIHGIGDYDYARRAVRANIPLWYTSRVLGVCKKNLGLDRVKFRNMPLRDRIKVLYSPKGFSLSEYCFYKKRHWGLGRSIFTWLHAWAACLFPTLFNRND